MKAIKNKGQDKTMNETTRRFARLVDLSAVQATSTEADVRACAELAARYNIISVHVIRKLQQNMQNNFQRSNSSALMMYLVDGQKRKKPTL